MSDAVATTVSLKDRLAARREELRRDRVIDLPVPGYESDLVARYAPLDYHVLRRIGIRSENEPDEIQGEINVAADVLVNACVGLFEKTADGLVPTGYRWSTSAAVELFGIPQHEVGSSARDAILKIFPSDTLLVYQYAEYSRQQNTTQLEIEEVVQGESKAA